VVTASAVAGDHVRGPRRHLEDLARLYRLVTDPAAWTTTAKDRKRLRDTAEPTWEVLEDSADRAAARAARRMLIAPPACSAPLLGEREDEPRSCPNVPTVDTLNDAVFAQFALIRSVVVAPFDDVTNRWVDVAWLSPQVGRVRVAIDRLPSDSLRARLMIDGQRYTATLPTEADACHVRVETQTAATGPVCGRWSKSDLTGRSVMTILVR